MIIHYPFVTEKATIMAEDNNVLQFIVDISATKDEIREEVEALYDVKVFGVNTMITPKGKKKATVFFIEPDTATELASRLGIF